MGGGIGTLAPVRVMPVRLPLASSRLVILAFKLTNRNVVIVPLPPEHIKLIFPSCSASPSACRVGDPEDSVHDGCCPNTEKEKIRTRASNEIIRTSPALPL